MFDDEVVEDILTEWSCFLCGVSLKFKDVEYFGQKLSVRKCVQKATVEWYQGTDNFSAICNRYLFDDETNQKAIDLENKIVDKVGSFLDTKQLIPITLTTSKEMCDVVDNFSAFCSIPLKNIETKMNESRENGEVYRAFDELIKHILGSTAKIFIERTVEKC